MGVRVSLFFFYQTRGLIFKGCESVTLFDSSDRQTLRVENYGDNSPVLRRSELSCIELTHLTRISRVSERDVLAIYYLYLTRMSLRTQLLYPAEYIF